MLFSSAIVAAALCYSATAFPAVERSIAQDSVAIEARNPGYGNEHNGWGSRKNRYQGQKYNNHGKGHQQGSSTKPPVGEASASATGSGPGASATASGSVTTTTDDACNGYYFTFTVTAEADSEVQVPLNGQPVSVSASAIAVLNIPAAIDGKGQCKVDSETATSDASFEKIGHGWHKEIEAKADAEASATITCTC